MSEEIFAILHDIPCDEMILEEINTDQQLSVLKFSKLTSKTGTFIYLSMI
jgi:hypothetical protein